MSRMTTLCLAVAIVGLGGGSIHASEGETPLNKLTPREQEEGWELLFNGTDTTGWSNYQGPVWKVEEGALVGPSETNGWLGTNAEYDNFHLRLEYWVDIGDTHESNSGMFIRADRTSGTPWVQGYEVQISLQDPKNPTGSIYGHVPTSLEQLKRKNIAPEKTWNNVDIRCMGPRMQVWVNGHPLQDAYLHVRDKGVIGVQQHHPGVTIKYRNIKVRKVPESEAEKGWMPMCNGKDLEGWTVRGKTKWEVDDEGAIVGTDGMGHLYYTAKELQDLEMRAMVWCDDFDGSGDGGNSGFYFRAHPPSGNVDNWPEGYETQVDITDDNWTTGCIYGQAKANDLVTLKGRWFAMRVRCQEKRVQTWVNGQLMVDTQLDTHNGPGYIALQGHNPGSQVKYKDLYYRLLD